MKIAIVEDNPQDQERLKNFLLRYGDEQGISMKIDCYPNGLAFVDQYQNFYDLVYFDIEMDLMDGMTAAQKLRKRDENVLIVFVTNFVQHAIRGYSVKAFDFLLKPLTAFNFQEHVQKVVHQMEKKQDSTIYVKSNSEIKRIDINQLLYIESQGHYLYLTLKNEIITTMDTMKNMEEKLKNKCFYRCNNGYIVNLKFVEKIEKNIVYVSGHRLQISRPRKKGFMEALTNYIGDDLL